MTLSRRLVTLLSLFLCLSASCKSRTAASGLNESDCYGPLEGHPTMKERAEFINTIASYAREAERVSGTPAAGLLALSVQQSGYGFTKLAMTANNIFGIRWTAESAAGRAFWVLECESTDAKYLKFADMRDAVLFVASKLATQKDIGGGKRDYAPKTARYIADRKAGVAVKEAVDRWIDGIGDAGYNADPVQFKTNVKGFAANLLGLSRDYSEPYNAYQYSKDIMPLTGAPATPAPQPAPAPTKTYYGIEGVVHMLGNESMPLKGATVSYQMITKTTDASGAFSMEGFAPGYYDLKVTLDGFNDKTVSVEVIDKALKMTIPLSPK